MTSSSLRRRPATAASAVGQMVPWPADESGTYDAPRSRVQAYVRGRPWVWSGGDIVFLCDVHADAEAVMRSLVMAGVLEGDAIAADGGDLGVRHASKDDSPAFEAPLVATAYGRSTTLVIGGDLLDKGPDNLALLRLLGRLRDAGLTLDLLAGNHDIRTIVGLHYAGHRDPLVQHMFVRMGKKTLTLFHEVWREQLAGAGVPAGPSEAELHALMFPGEEWYASFPRVAKGRIPERKLAKEVVRIREKVVELQAKCKDLGMSLRDLWAAMERCRDLFLRPGGEFAWIFERMRLMRREGSLLFVHAGVDDVVAELLAREGEAGCNALYRRLLDCDLFELYHGSIGNAFRTKYRDIDLPFGARGERALRSAGIAAIVHGHRNVAGGQKLVVRQGVLNFECDASIDRNTRKLERIPGPGGAATLFRPDGSVVALSTDHARVRCFDPAELGAFVTLTNGPALRT